MAEKLQKIGIKKEDGYLYFVDKDGDLSRAKMAFKKLTPEQRLAREEEKRKRKDAARARREQRDEINAQIEKLKKQKKRL